MKNEVFKKIGRFWEFPKFHNFQIWQKSMVLAYINLASTIFIRFLWYNTRFEADIIAEIMLFTKLNYLEYPQNERENNSKNII